MDRNVLFVTVFLLYLLIVDSCAAEKDINKENDPGSDVDPKIDNLSGKNLSRAGSNSDTVRAEEGKQTALSSGASEGKTETDATKQHDLTEQSSDGNDTGGRGKGKEEGGMGKNSGVDGGNQKGSTTEGLGTNVAKDGSSKGVDPKSSRKENSRPEECDAAFSCVDDKNKLVACLQVPGNESPDLSLLIQNRGRESLTVTITAPSAVRLEKTTVQLPKNEDEKVKVSIGDGVSNETLIILKAGRGICKLNFKDIAVQSSGKGAERSQHTTRPNYLKGIFAIYVLSAALLLVGGAWACVKCQQRYGGPKYQKLDMELPVSSGEKTEMAAAEGWDSNWGDSWDDEEAPMTPQRTSNPSSRGLASRRSNNKDGWQNNWKD